MRSYSSKEDLRSTIQAPVALHIWAPSSPEAPPSSHALPGWRVALTVLWVMTYRCSKAPSKMRSLLTADPCWMIRVEYGWPSLPGPK